MKRYAVVVCSIVVLAGVMAAQAPPSATQPALKPEVREAILTLQRDLANLQVDFVVKSQMLSDKLASAGKDSGLGDGWIVDPNTLAVSKAAQPPVKVAK